MHKKVNKPSHFFILMTLNELQDHEWSYGSKISEDFVVQSQMKPISEIRDDDISPPLTG